MASEAVEATVTEVPAPAAAAITATSVDVDVRNVGDAGAAPASASKPQPETVDRVAVTGTRSTRADRETLVTSAAIVATEDGNFPFHTADWLVPHETLRREFHRAHHALLHIDPVAAPWKVFGFEKWLTKYLWPAVHSHHDIEETVIGPFWQAKGENIEFGNAHTHEELIRGMDEVAQLVDTLSKLAVALPRDGSKPSEAQVGAVNAAFAAVRTRFVTLKEHMLSHLQQEDAFWPAVYARHTPEECKACVKRIVDTELAKTGPEHIAFKGFTGALMNAMLPTSVVAKHNAHPSPSHALQIPPWCSTAQADHFMLEIPWVPRTFIFPAWHAEYLRTWKRLIESLSGDVNVTGVDAPGLARSRTCGCM